MCVFFVVGHQSRVQRLRQHVMPHQHLDVKSDVISISLSDTLSVLSYYSSLSSKLSPNTIGILRGIHIVNSVGSSPSRLAMPKATENNLAKALMIKELGTESQVPCSCCVRNYRNNPTVECKRHIAANKRKKCGRCFLQGGVLCLQVRTFISKCDVADL